MPRENHPDGFLKHRRAPIGKRPPAVRVRDVDEVWAPDWDDEHLRTQAERCVDCGVPTCMSGCPIGNIIPNWNDLVYRSDWKQALEELHATNNFPEFTGYTCPAPCEDTCVLAANDDAVAIKSIERAIVDRGWEEGWITPQPPTRRTDYHVAVVGSGPAGLAAAQQLNRAGHRVTVFERDETPGGLMQYGIPDFKFAKHRVEQRIQQLRDEGIRFATNTDVGTDVTLDDLQRGFDATCLAIGAQHHRDLTLPGRDLDGIRFAMDYLPEENRRQAGQRVRGVTAEGKNVVVLGGGDTGADCVATAHRQGARQVVQISINPRPPEDRPSDNPWPAQPQTYRKTYAQEEGGEEAFSINTQAFLDTDGDGRVDALQAEHVDWTYDRTGRRVDKTVVESDVRIPADLVLIAIGFAGPEPQLPEAFGVDRAPDGTIQTNDAMMTSVDGLFAAGDATRGASLVVWAIGEGRDVARQIDRYLTGRSDLPASVRTSNPAFDARA
ncbi:MAG: glutamate synthase small subunit [Bacteroidetes bacterium]|nr:glutamate synthase small subunit [Bacteroidota bacterium]